MHGWLSSVCRLGNSASSGRKWGTRPFSTLVPRTDLGVSSLFPPDSSTTRGRHRWLFTAPRTYLSKKGTITRTLWIPQNLKESWRDRREHSAARDHPTERPGGGGTYLLGGCLAVWWNWSPDTPVRPQNTGNPVHFELQINNSILVKVCCIQ